MLVDATANQARKRRSVAGRQRQQQQQQQPSQQQILQREPRVHARRSPGHVPPLDRSSISSTLMDASAAAAGRRRGGEEVDRLLRQFPRNRLRIVEKLGEGSFGMVSQSVDEWSAPFALLGQIGEV